MLVFLIRCVRTSIPVKSLVIILLYICFAIFFFFYARRLPYSYFYNPDVHEGYTNIIRANQQRITQAEEVLRNLDCTGKCLGKMNEDTILPEFCFVIISVSRPEVVKYLTQVVASLVPQVTSTNSVFVVYNAEGATHYEAVNLSAIVPVEPASRETATRFTKYAREKDDYMYALNWCHKRRARFSVILEDDALPRNDFVYRLKFILNHRMSKNSKKWAFLKLFYPEKWLGWANEPRLITELILTSLLGGFALTLFTYCVQLLIVRSFTIADRRVAEPLIRFLLSCALCAYLLVALGRPHWLALRNASVHFSSTAPAPGCCTPGVVYPETHLKELIGYLDKVKCSSIFPIDVALDKFADDRGLERLLAIPNLIRHIGFVSSLPGKGWKNPKEFMV